MNNLEFEALCRSFEGIYPGASSSPAQPETDHASILMAGAVSSSQHSPGAMAPGTWVLYLLVAMFVVMHGMRDPFNDVSYLVYGQGGEDTAMQLSATRFL